MPQRIRQPTRSSFPNRQTLSRFCICPMSPCWLAYIRHSALCLRSASPELRETPETTLGSGGQTNVSQHRPLLAACATLAATLVFGTADAVAGSGQALSAGNEQRRACSAYSASQSDWTAQQQLAALMDAHCEPLEAALLADAADGRLDDHTLLAAALIASGVNDRATLRRREAAFGSLVQQLHHNLADSPSLRHKAESVFQFMHTKLLFGGYALQSTDLRETLQNGKYNCLTATILYNCLANEVGLPACALESPGHVLSRVFLPDGFLDVETTCPRWFQLSSRPVEQAQHVRQTLGIARDNPTRPLREASELELVAMIYYNRGVDMLAAGRFAEAAAANLKSLRLCPNSPAPRGNLLATINNWAIALARQHQFAEAAQLLRLGMAVEPTFQTFMVNYVYLYQQWAAQLCQQGRADQAIRMLQQQAAVFPEEPFFAEAAAAVQRRQHRLAVHDQPDLPGASQLPVSPTLIFSTGAPRP